MKRSAVNNRASKRNDFIFASIRNQMSVHCIQYLDIHQNPVFYLRFSETQSGPAITATGTAAGARFTTYSFGKETCPKTFTAAHASRISLPEQIQSFFH